MNFFQQLADSALSGEPQVGTEQAVTVHLKLSGHGFGTEEEQYGIYRLSDELATAIDCEAVGELDGDEYGDGECVLFMYGADADALFTAVEPMLRASALAEGAYVIKRYGDVGDPSVREVRIDL